MKKFEQISYVTFSQDIILFPRLKQSVNIWQIVPKSPKHDTAQNAIQYLLYVA